MVFGESPFKDVYRRVVWGPWRELLVRLPPTTEIRANDLLGRVAARAVRGKRRAVEANLRRAFPNRAGLERIAEQTFRTHFVEQYISWSFARIDPETADRYLEIHGLDHLDRALEQGRGAVLMHPHMGPAQLPLAVLGVRGYAVNQVGGGGVTVELSPTGRWAEAMRHRLEGDIRGRIWDGKGFLRPVLRALQAGEVVLTAMDGTGGGREIGRRVVREVLGHRMRIPVGPAYLALRSGAPLLPLVTYRNPGRGAPYVSEIDRPVELPRDRPLREGLEAGADAIAARLERELALHPGDWHFWDEFEPGRFLVAEEAR